MRSALMELQLEPIACSFSLFFSPSSLVGLGSSLDFALS